MNKYEKTLYLLGNIRAKVENITHLAYYKDNCLFDIAAELEAYINKSINDIFNNDKENFKWNF